MTPCQARGRLFFHRDRLSFRTEPVPREGRGGIHKKGIYFAVDSAGAAPVLREGGEIACPGEGQGRCRKIIQSAIMKKSRFFALAK